MKRYFFATFLLFSFLLVACESFTPKEESENDLTYLDPKYGVSFEYPAHWETRTKDDRVSFAANFDYSDGFSESSTSTELEGTLSYSVIQNPENLGMRAFYDASYAECRSELIPDDADFGPVCRQPRLESGWKVFEIDGTTAYQSDWKGMPESGEMSKDLYVDLSGKGVFIHLSAIKTGMTDEEAIQKTAEDAFESLRIELTGEVAAADDLVSFDGCGDLSTYETQAWYNEFQSSASSLTKEYRSISKDGVAIKEKPATLEDVSDACYSENGDIFIVLIPGAYLSGPSIYRFNTESSELSRASLDDKNQTGLSSPKEFGERIESSIGLTGRDGDAGVTVIMSYNYDFVENSIELTKSCTSSESSPEEKCVAY
jgi:hypothetical protein